MNPDLEQLMSILSCVRYRGDQHSHALIEETDTLATLKKVKIEAGSGDWFLFDPDRGRFGGKGKSKSRSKPVMSPLLADNYQRACDAAIATLRGDVLWLIFIELKSSSAASGYSGQFRNTRQFARYLCGLLQEFNNISFTSIRESFVILHPPLPQNKRPTVSSGRVPPSDDPASPVKHAVTNGGVVYLNQLVP